MVVDLFIEVTYPVMRPAEFSIKTNVKDGKVPEVIEEFLRAQMGKGKDSSPPNRLQEFKIRLELDLDGDKFSSSTDTGNLGLRDGILMDIVRRLRTKSE